MNPAFRPGYPTEDTGMHRYTLWFNLPRLRPVDDPTYRTAAFVGLNPSDGRLEKNDPTLTRVLGYAKKMNVDSIVMINLFAYRSPSPAALMMVGRDKAIGVDNDGWLSMCCAYVDEIVCCWGVGGSLYAREWQTLEMLRAIGCWSKLRALSTTRDGHPQHPLYLPSHLTPTVWRP